MCPRGIVKIFNSDRGFGFIKRDDSGLDTFVHVSDVARAGLTELREGMRRGFEVETDLRRGKTKAVQLRLI